MKEQNRQFMIAGMTFILLVIGLFSWMVYVDSENRKNMTPCNEYDHLHESMQPVRCSKESAQ